MKKKITLICSIFCFVCLACIGQTPGINYATPQILTNGTAITDLRPDIIGTGIVITGYTVSPNLPAGLALDPTSGVITGTPTSVSASADYTITAATATSSYTALLNITINFPIPEYGRYSLTSVELTVDAPMSPINPTVSIPNSFFDMPKPLPDGLRLNHQTGEISGTPLKAVKEMYKVIRINNNQKTTYNIYITVAPQPDVVADAPTISFVGQGNIQQSLNSGAAIAANTGIGVVYKQNSSRRYGVLHNIEIDFSINVASTVDTIKSTNNAQNIVTNKQDFGNSVLLPLNSGQAFSFNFKGYFTEKGGNNGNYRRNNAPKSLGGVLSGFTVALNGSNRNWEYDAYNAPDATTKTPGVLVKTSLLSFYVGPFFEFVTPSKDNNYGKNASITLGAGYSGRWILGDVQQSTLGNLRNELLGSTANSFNGAEITLGLRFYNIKAEVHLPFFSNKAPIPGLTGTHLTTFIGFSGGFPIDLTKTSSQ